MAIGEYHYPRECRSRLHGSVPSKRKIYIRLIVQSLLEERGGLGKIFEDGFPEGFEQIGQATDQVQAPKAASDKTLRDYYANLEVEYGADMDTVKAAYRNLMRKYHPDKFAHDENMQQLSTQLSQEITRAYQAIESYWKHGKY